jgi:hypothetical protein
MSARLSDIGDQLERAARADLAATARRRRRVVRRRAAACAAAVVVLVPGAAVARSLLTTSDVAASMPAGTLFLAGTEPTCTVVHEGVEFHCTVDHAVNTEVSDLKGTVEPTVDTSHIVNGGCRSQDSKGLEWECYVGKAAVDQQIIGPDFLGQKSAGPGVG